MTKKDQKYFFVGYPFSLWEHWHLDSKLSNGLLLNILKFPSEIMLFFIILSKI